MATNEVLIRADTTPIMFATTAYVPDANDSLGSAPGSTILDVAGLTAGQARGSVKQDLGVDHAERYSLTVAVEAETDPTAGDRVDLYWSPSDSATAAVGNLGPDVTGADADYAGTGHGYTLAEALKQMIHAGSLILAVQNDADGVQIGFAGVLEPGPHQYGTLIYHWNSTVVLFADSVECAVRMTPVIPDIQAAA